MLLESRQSFLSPFTNSRNMHQNGHGNEHINHYREVGALAYPGML